VKHGCQLRIVVNLLCCWLFVNMECGDVRACTYSSMPTAIGRSFLVSVNDRGRPVAGLQIELTIEGKKKDHTIAIVETDAKGNAKFEHVRPGLYFVGIKQPAFGYSEEIRVMPHPPKGSPEGFSFEWPGWEPLSTTAMVGSITGRARTDRGFLLDTTQPVYTTVAGAKLTLLKAVSDEPVEAQISNDNGGYEFREIPAGLYLLHVETPVLQPLRWGYPTDGYVPIEVDPGSEFHRLDIVLDNAICGELGWKRREETDSINAQTH
jgi:hypothetical protein